MSENHTAINQTMANLYAISKTWYEIRDKNITVEDMEKMFTFILDTQSFHEVAREGRNLMAQLKEKYAGLEATSLT